MSDRHINAGLVAPGEYAPAGEAQGEEARFSAEQIARGFEVEIDRVHRAMSGEFGLGADGRVDSRQAQHLAEVILGDQTPGRTGSGVDAGRRLHPATRSRLGDRGNSSRRRERQARAAWVVKEPAAHDRRSHTLHPTSSA